MNINLKTRGVLSARLLASVAALAACATPLISGTAVAGAATPAVPVASLFSTPLGVMFGTDAPGPVPSTGVKPLVSGCIAVSSTPVSFTSSIGPSWTTLDIRTHPFQSCPVTGAFHTGSAFHVDHSTAIGQKIALHPSLCGNVGSPASSVWYHTTHGWSWSGGTSDPVWNTSC
jgi:hypothetical protein